MWRCAIGLWVWNPSGTLCDSLVGELMVESMWKQSLQVVNHLLNIRKLSCGDAICIDDHVGEPDGTTGRFVVGPSDTMRVAYDPTFVPVEECGMSSGLCHLITSLYPTRSQWHQAVCLLVQLSESGTSADTAKELLELAAARSAYQGRRFEDVFKWSLRCRYVHTSCSLQRTLLRAAIAVSCWEEAFATLDKLVMRRVEEVPVITLCELCRGFMKEYGQGKHVNLLDKFSTIIMKCWELFRTEMKLEIKSFFEFNAVDTGALEVDSFSNEFVVSGADGKSLCGSRYPISVTDMDKLTSLLLNKGHWKAALHLLSKFSESEWSNEREKVIVNAARASMRCWETALLFVS
ncbi:hypothetical protein DPX39_100119400 [Trypanosoma brucei equiperdum]|uniref:Uncharacterized protein n=1 Tax=Trypanosoma brucei equiperdum TaxID=630700 RepID=A0A3L6KZF3_9TRYP|nr:hypothetical protein DPX39_100119400 [Trypanosoma brucei equiperdum]